MLCPRRVLCWRPFGVVAGPVLYFVLYGLYLLFCVNPSLIYEADQITTCFPIARHGVGFLDEVLMRPGGLAGYVTILLSQYYYYAWVGALIISVGAVLLCAAAAVLWRALGGRPPWFVPYLPAVLVAMLCSQYTHVLGTCVSLTAAVFFACVHVWLSRRKAAFGPVLFIVLSCLVYCVAAEGYVVFAAVCVIAEAAGRRRFLLSAAYLGLASAVPYVVGAYVFRIRPGDALGSLVPERASLHWYGQAFVVALYAVFPATALVAGLRRKAGAERAAAEAQATQALRQGRPPRWLWRTAALLLVTAALVLPAWDRGSRALLRIEWCSRRRMWDQLLLAARKVPVERYDVLVQWEVNRALHHAGRLLDEMFTYPQTPYALTPTVRDLGLDAAVVVERAFARTSAVLFDLGRVNEAERRTCEAMECLGDRPELIERMALIGALKGQTEAARIWLGALKENPIYRARAAAYLRRLAVDPSLSDDPQVQLVRSRLVVTDQVGTGSLEDMVTQSLQANPRNRMAAEYLFADHLLKGRLEKVASSIARLDDLGRRDVPRHLQEALLIYAAQTRLPVDLHGRTISSEAAERYVAFAEAVRARQKDDARAAAKALAADWGGTYFYYYTFGPAGRAP